MDTRALRTGWNRTWLGAALSITLILFYGALIAAIVVAVVVNNSVGQAHGA